MVGFITAFFRITSYIVIYLIQNLKMNYLIKQLKDFLFGLP